MIREQLGYGLWLVALHKKGVLADEPFTFLGIG